MLVLAVTSLRAAPAFVYENAYELQSGGDFDGNGLPDLVILDKATGSYRIAYQLTPGNCSWVSARASGIANATGLGLGKLDSLTFDSLAVTGPDANRINVLDANNTAYRLQSVMLRAVEHILEQVQPEERVALYAFGSRFVTIHDFTSDTASLLATLRKYHGEVPDFAWAVVDPDLGYNDL